MIANRQLRKVGGVLILLGGLLYAASGGNEAKLERAKELVIDFHRLGVSASGGRPKPRAPRGRPRFAHGFGWPPNY